MKSNLLRLLRCPASGRPLSYIPFAENGQEALPEGVLVVDEKCWYPVMDGVPRFLDAATGHDLADFHVRHRKKILAAGLLSPDRSAERASECSQDLRQTRQSFGYKWNSHPEWGIRKGSAHVTQEWMLKKYGWEEEARFREHMRGKKAVLDAGTGLGREVIHFAEANPEALVYGMDLSDSVLSAVRHTCAYPKTMVVQADLMKPPFARTTFDFILAEGVLHHTRDTRAALHSLVRLLAPGGEIAFYIYRKKGAVREFSDDFIREKVSRLSPEDAMEAVKPLTLLGQVLSRIEGEVEVPEIPLLQIRAGTYPVQRLLYWHFLKCFWNESLSLEENNLVNFDWYHPHYANRHTRQEVIRWLDELGLECCWEHEEEAGITIRARRT
ncbi:MAG: methyltransferase domain-containing protein [Deltaproteobacteria bacterium]|nr:methyltransferase domain-containing protein [Deltaproteobacteria bacterium]